MLVGVDIGGTFTDVVLSTDGRLTFYKLLSTPANPAEAMLAGIAAVTPDQPPQQVAHGSTVATNAILERKGARIAFLTTEGFRDLLFIGRQTRPELYALHPQRPAPLLPRERCYEIPERLDHRGEVLTPLNMKALDKVLDQLAKEPLDGVAVCFLYSYLNPDHEQAVRHRILDRGLLQAWQVALSCEVLPEFREYERASTTTLEAYVRPVMARYLDHLRAALPASTALRIMKSDGGVMSAARVREQAVNTVLSGPAAGVIGAFAVARQAGYDQIITLDMGGTSTDVALCPGRVQLSPDSQVDRLPLRVSMLDIETIGAGGGSLVRLDAGGALRVGPQSAGADPGPIIYGRGGQQLTVSDANALLARLDAAHFLGGRMSLDLEAARAALDDLAAQMVMDPEQVARGVLDIANASIERALRRVSIARGYDPRHFTLVAFGGAGPLHACAVAQRLEMRRVLIPPAPGVLCALGLLVADLRVEYRRAVLARASRALLARLRAALGELIEAARRDLLAEGVAEDQISMEPLLEMRYAGQAYELEIPFRGDELRAFHQAHQAAYGHAFEDRPVEVVNLRLRATGHIQPPPLVPHLPNTTLEDAYLGSRPGPQQPIQRYARERLPAGASFTGEALVFQMDSTTYVPPDWSAHVDAFGNLILEYVG